VVELKEDGTHFENSEMSDNGQINSINVLGEWMNEWFTWNSTPTATFIPSSTVDCGFDPQSGQTKNYKIGICCFSAKQTTLRRKSKDWSTRNQNNVSEWNDMSTRRLLFQWARTLKIHLGVLV